jgi:CBS domain-containing protein
MKSSGDPWWKFSGFDSTIEEMVSKILFSKQATRAGDIMTSRLVVIHPGQTYREAIELLTQNRLTGLPVVSQGGKLLGFLSEKEVLAAGGRFSKSSREFLDSKIRYKKIVKVANLRTPLDRVAEMLSGKAYRHLPIVDEQGVLRGIITRRDLIRILYARIELTGRVE